MAAATPSNPTDGSRWILKVQPTWQRRLRVIPPTAVGGYLKSNLQPNLRRRRRLNFNHPPTAVGGIRRKGSRCVGWILIIHRLPSVGFAAIRCRIYFSKTIIRHYLARFHSFRVSLILTFAFGTIPVRSFLSYH